MTRALTAVCWVAALLLTVPPAAAEATASIVVRAGKSDSANHLLARQFAEALVLGGNGAFTLDVRESQGSVQNVIEAARSKGNYIFTAPPSIIGLARRGSKPFERNPRYNDIRALFPIPFQTLQWVVRQDSGIKTLSDLAGHSFVPGGKGGVSERLTATALQVLGIEKRVQLIDIDVGAAPAAVMGNRVSGLAMAGSYPIPALVALAKAAPIRLVSLTPQELAKIVAADDSTAAQIVPKGTYPGVDEDVTTIALPVGAYTTRRMADRTAYDVTKLFWAQRTALAERNPPWQSVSPATIAALGVKLHPGALRYYDEAHIKVPAALR